MSRYLKILIILTGLLTGSAAVTKTQAADTSATKGITVTPAFQQASIQAGEPEHPLSFSVTNNEPRTQTLELSSADFNTLNESGGLLFVGTNPTALQKKYGLAKWLSLPQKQITLAPKQTAIINASILNLPDLAPGGHYGALMLAIAGSSSSQFGNKIALHPIASSLLFVTKLGGDTHKLGLQSVSLRHNIFSLPGSVTLRFHNDGNTHLIPRGTVTITDPSGRLVSKGIINDNSGLILPGTFRRYYVPLQSIASSNSPGHYKVRVGFRFDGLSQIRSYRQSFLYLPLGELILIVIILVAIFYVAYQKLTKPKKI